MLRDACLYRNNKVASCLHRICQLLATHPPLSYVLQRARNSGLGAEKRRSRYVFASEEEAKRAAAAAEGIRKNHSCLIDRRISAKCKKQHHKHAEAKLRFCFVVGLSVLSTSRA